jgi:lysophospholipase L1-like esterase
VKSKEIIIEIMNEVLGYLWLLVLSIYLKIKYLWMKWNKFTFERILPVNSLRHKILIIGDGVAEGWGDDRLMAMRQPGLASRLHNRLSNSHNIRQRWQVVSCGVLGSTSKDWLPSTPNYLNATHNSKYSDSEIVLVVVGGEDYRRGITPEQTVENIKQIVKSIYEMDKQVYVSTLLRSPRDYEKTRLIPDKSHVEFVNESLKQWISDCSEKVYQKRVRLGADLASFEIFWRRDFYISDDYQAAGNSLLHLNHKGYDKAAELWQEVLLSDIVKYEFKIFSQKLQT